MKKTLAILGAVLVIAAGLIWTFGFAKSGGIQKGPEAVLTTMFTGPNDKLYDPEAVQAIGLGVNQTPEQQQKAEQAAQQVQQNWQDALGQYFAPNCFEPFLNNAGGHAFVFQAGETQQTLKLNSMELQGEGDLYQDILVNYTLGDQAQQALVKFALDKDGLITKVEIIPQ